jgi:hypothetical protein
MLEKNIHTRLGEDNVYQQHPGYKEIMCKCGHPRVIAVNQKDPKSCGRNVCMIAQGENP